MGDREFERELLVEFFTAMPQTISSLHAFLDEDDRDQLRFVVHALKGSSRALGADRLAAQCQLLEDATCDDDPARARHAIAALTEAYAELRAYAAVHWGADLGPPG